VRACNSFIKYTRLGKEGTRQNHVADVDGPKQKHVPLFPPIAASRNSSISTLNFPNKTRKISHCFAQESGSRMERRREQIELMPTTKSLLLFSTCFSDSMDQFGKFTQSVCFEILPRCVRSKALSSTKSTRAE